MVLKALALAEYKGFVDVVLGAANPHEKTIRDLFQKCGFKGEVNLSVSDLAYRISVAAAGFTSIGLTTYEMEALGLPMFIVSGNGLNKVVAEIYAIENPNAVFLGDVNNLTEIEISDRFVALFNSIKNCFSSKVRHSPIGSKSAVAVEKIKDLIIKLKLK